MDVRKCYKNFNILLVDKKGSLPGIPSYFHCWIGRSKNFDVVQKCPSGNTESLFNDRGVDFFAILQHASNPVQALQPVYGSPSWH